MILEVCLELAIAGLPAVDRFEVEPRRVDGESWRDVASAQVPLGAFEPIDLAWSGGEAFRCVSALFDRSLALTWIVESGGGERGLEVLWVDADGDGHPDEAEQVEVEFDEHGSFRQMISLDRFGLPIELLLFTQGEERKATALTLYHFEAGITIGASLAQITFVDLDLSGSVTAGDQWLALDGDFASTVRPSSIYFESHRADEPCYLGERVLRLTGFEPDGIVSLELSPQDRPRHVFMAERAARIVAEWNAKLDTEYEDFCSQWGIDPERPRDPNPPAWHYALDLEEALAVAERAGKPLFVEYRSDGCGWCKRNDWMNFRDAAVTAELRKFALVKVNREIDPSQSATALGLDGAPSYAVFDTSGEATFTSFGWRRPSAFAAVLGEAWATVQQAP